MALLESFNGTQILWLFAGSGIFLFVLTLFIKWRLRSNTSLHLKTGAVSGENTGRTKYRNVDVFRYRSTFTLLGVALGLLLTLALFNFTTAEIDLDEGYAVATIDEDITVEPPRTAEPPPPPPPPPPPVIEEVPDELLLEEEDNQVFLDQSIDAETEIEVAPPPEVKEVIAAPPPPPPPVEEVEEIFKVVEEMPRFPGCEDQAISAAEKKQCADKKLMAFIYDNIQYPAVARENNIQGSVVVSFVVNADGSIEQIKVMRDIGGGCGEEVKRVLNQMTEQGIKWIPGKQRAKAVRVQFILPVKFLLSS